MPWDARSPTPMSIPSATRRPRIVVTGAQGQVGFELARLLPAHGDVTALTRQQLDLAQPDAIVATMRALRPDLVVNAAAAYGGTRTGPFGGGPIADAAPEAFDSWSVAAARSAFAFLSSLCARSLS